MTLIGVKFTTARAAAARAVATAAHAVAIAPRGAGRSSSASGGQDTRTTSLPGAGIADHEALAIETARTVHLELAPPLIRHLTSLYGDRCAAIVRLMAERSEWRMPLAAGLPNVGAEVIHAIRAEMACTLADVVIRRTEQGAMGHPGAETVRGAAGIAAEELNWDAARLTAEIDAVDAMYRIGDAPRTRSEPS
jgi:glycerol-3-phosphate dehydrogenase